MRKESVLSIATAARRTGSLVTVLGEKNTQILCEINLQKPMGLAWFVNGSEATAAEVSRVLDTIQGVDHESPGQVHRE